MANIKTGFIFYKVDTDRFLDIRIKRLKKDRGCEGYAVYEYLLNEIYRVKGCFLAYDENTAFDAAEYWGLEESQVNDIVDYCCACGLFDKGLFTSAGVLTSRSIQSRYIEMSRIAKRTSYNIPTEYDLISGVKRDSSGSLTDSSGSLDDYSVCLPQSKVKKRKYIPPIVPPSGGDRENISSEETMHAIHDDCTEDAAISEADASAVNSPCSRNRFSTPSEESSSAIHDDCTEDAAISEADASAVKRARRHRFMPPSIEEVAAYCEKRQNGIDPQSFIDHYSAVGWKVGRNRMSDWQAAVRTWENRRKKDQSHHNSAMDYKIPL